MELKHLPLSRMSGCIFEQFHLGQRVHTILIPEVEIFRLAKNGEVCVKDIYA